MNNSILLYPHKSLTRKTKPITLDYIHTDEFRFRISAMFRMMYYRNGVGLAAPQVGWNASVFVANPTGKPEHISKSLVVINPEILVLGGSQASTEGCLSLPSIWVPVKRHDRIRVKSLSEQGREIEIEASGFLSTIIQHEYDHLQGTMMIDRVDDAILSNVDKELFSHVKRVRQLRSKREHNRKKHEAKKKKIEKSRAKNKAKRKRKKK